jgi:signal transduction histidine kinase
VIFNGLVAGSSLIDDPRLLLDLARTVTSSLDLQAVLDTSLAALRRLIDFGGGSIQLIRDGALVLVAGDPAPTPDAYAMRVPVGRGVGGRIAASGESIYIPDIRTDVRVPPAGHRALSTGVRSYFGVPLILHGEPIGVVQLDSPERDGFPIEARTLMIAFAPTIAAAVQNAELFAREQETNERLRAAEQLQSDFLAMVSHELRTPLTTLTGFAEMIADHAGALQPTLVADVGRRMWRASRWLSRMIVDLLDVAQLERGTLVIELQPTDVTTAVIEATTIDVRDSRPITSRIAPNLPPVIADPGRLQQVLGNLLSNARKFSPQGSEITIDCDRDGSNVMITVVDRGRGMPPEAMDHIFDLFVQIDPATTRASGGLGTGLYLAKQLCDRMGAKITVESDPGAGSRFTVLLRSAQELQAVG